MKLSILEKLVILALVALGVLAYVGVLKVLPQIVAVYSRSSW